jgi:hypothetical protein
MAKSGSAAIQSAQPVDKSTFNQFIRKVNSRKADCDSANMEHAGEWKRAEDLNIHKGAAKLTAKLKRMDSEKRAHFLRAFDIYRDYEVLDDHEDLVDQAEEAAADESTNVTPIDSAKKGKGKGKGKGGGYVEQPAITQEAEKLAAEEEAGFAACTEGHKKTTNPNDSDLMPQAYEAWNAGWDQAFMQNRFGESAPKEEEAPDREAKSAGT